MKDLCFIKIDLKDSRFFANALNLDHTVLQRQICIKGDAQFISEQERSNGTSVWDIRIFGKLNKDDNCLFLNSDLDSETYLPIKIFPGSVTNHLERSLVHGIYAILAVYILSFLFTVFIWKTIFEILSFIRNFWTK